jgi:molybdenum cofactor guanylyltransferase
MVAPPPAPPGIAGPGRDERDERADRLGLPDFDAVILAGGRARRLGGADKPGLMVGTTTMAGAVAAAAAAAGARTVVLVGPPRPELTGLAATLPGGLIVTREEPPGGGPVPALRAGLARVTAPWVAVLAADLPFLRAADVRELVAAAARDQYSGSVLQDDQGSAQWLAGCWQASRLRGALDGYAGSSLRGVLAPLAPVLLQLAGAGQAPPPWLDCDTPEALEAARLAARAAPPARPAAPAAPSAGRAAPPAARASAQARPDR